MTGIGEDMASDARHFGLAARIAAERGALYVKRCFVDEGLERATAGCPVPIESAGGWNLPERDAWEMAFKAVDRSAAGVDKGRKIFQFEYPGAMIPAVSNLALELMSANQAHEMYPGRKGHGQAAPRAGLAPRWRRRPPFVQAVKKPRGLAAAPLSSFPKYPGGVAPRATGAAPPCASRPDRIGAFRSDETRPPGWPPPGKL
ncbi:MAG: hypothetical protein D6801_03230 [Alphaproteobacteria bacterium]|nr:MAG: hypothetical protein D6801_03230 [Alphaproteobacteria bacterium]